MPGRTDTAWWHEWVARGQVRFLRGRVQVSGQDAAPFPSAVVVFRNAPSRNQTRNQTCNETVPAEAPPAAPCLYAPEAG